MKSIDLVLNEEKDIAVHGKGAMGLVLSYECDNPGIVELKGKDGIMPDDHSIGGEVSMPYTIKGIAKGKTKITFYHTRPWVKDFQRILEGEYMVEVK